MKAITNWRFKEYVMETLYKDLKGIQCSKKEYAEKLIAECNTYGFTWRSGVNETHWDKYGSDTVYTLHAVKGERYLLYTYADVLPAQNICMYKDKATNQQLLERFTASGLTKEDLVVLSTLLK